MGGTLTQRRRVRELSFASSEQPASANAARQAIAATATMRRDEAFRWSRRDAFVCMVDSILSRGLRPIVSFGKRNRYL